MGTCYENVLFFVAVTALCCMPRRTTPASRACAKYSQWFNQELFLDTIDWLPTAARLLPIARQHARTLLQTFFLRPHRNQQHWSDRTIAELVQRTFTSPSFHLVKLGAIGATQSLITSDTSPLTSRNQDANGYRAQEKFAPTTLRSAYTLFNVALCSYLSQPLCLSQNFSRVKNAISKMKGESSGHWSPSLESAANSFFQFWF